MDGRSRVADRVIIIRINEVLPPIPMFGQSRRDRRIVVEPPGLSPPAKPKQDKEHNRSRGESHDHKDTGHRPFILEEA